MSARFLHAAILASDANAARASRRSLEVVVEGRIAAVTGLPLRSANAALTGRAIAHDRVMQILLEKCSAVMPFRLDTRAPIEADLHRLLRDNGPAIEANLLRFQGRVEMGLKATSRNGRAFAQHLHCDHIQKLAGPTCNRRERIVVLESGILFEGTYLVPKDAVDDFWTAVLQIRKDLPGFAVLGTGPWAPYSFCDLELPSHNSTSLKHSA